MTDAPHTVLIDAAAKARALANAATQDDDNLDFVWAEDARASGGMPNQHANTELIRLGSPDMWRLIADWLDAEALFAQDGWEPLTFHQAKTIPNTRAALALASAVLGKGEDDD